MGLDHGKGLEAFKDCQATVVLWREGWLSDRIVAATVREALEIAKADTSAPLKVEVLVHATERDIPLEGDTLRALIAEI